MRDLLVLVRVSSIADLRSCIISSRIETLLVSTYSLGALPNVAHDARDDPGKPGKIWRGAEKLDDWNDICCRLPMTRHEGAGVACSETWANEVSHETQANSACEAVRSRWIEEQMDRR